MLVVPAAMAVTTPPTLMVPTVRLLLCHVPPDGTPVNVDVKPAQADNVPVIAGVALIVSVAVRTHVVDPAIDTYVAVAFPARMPVTVPELLPIVAIDVLLLVHVPPLGLPVRVLVEPSHTVLLLEITGSALMVAVDVTLQPPLNVYEMIVVPAVAAVTTPDELPTEATPGVPLVHVPPLVALLSVIVPPAPHMIIVAGEIAAGIGFTVTSLVAKQPVAVIV